MKYSDELNKDIKKEFDADLEIPESLSRNNMVKLLKEKGTQEKKTKIKILPKVLSAAAMIAIIAATTLTIGLQSNFVPVTDNDVKEETTQTLTTQSAVKPETEEEESVIVTTTEAQKNENLTKDNLPKPVLKVAKSKEDLENHFLKFYAEDKIEAYVDIAINTVGDFIYFSSDKSADSAVEEAYGAVMDNMAPTMAATSSAVTAAPQASQSTNRGEGTPHGTTNVQVADVDEGDIIKNDGKYLYIVNSDISTGNNRLTIVNAQTMLKVYQGSIMPKEEDQYMNIRDIYVNGDILTAVCNYSRKTYAVTYDITQRHAPKEMRRVEQDGTYTSSRMVDGILYLVTDYRVSGSSAEEVKENAIPSVNCDCIPYSCCYIVDEESTSYVVLSAFDTKEKDSEVSSISVLGNGFNVYSTADTLYVYSYAYDDKEAMEYTEIYSFSIDGTDLKHKATGTVPGSTVNQYSFDDYKGYLRVATTRYDYRKNIDISSVYILNSKLEKVGEVFDLADDEQVKAVRFMGDTGYVVTFRNTDPLFILDLSDPTNPTVTGELKIPGYSSYIHPIGDNYLVGVGYNGTDEAVDSDSVKVSVFDVSDKTNPVETDTFVIKKAYSLVNSNPKAFFWYSERNLVGIPVSFYNNGNNTVKSIQTLEIKDGKVVSDLGYIHYNNSSQATYGTYSSSSSYVFVNYWYSDLFRGTYIGNKLYTIDDFDVIEHDLDSGEETRRCVIGSREMKKQVDVNGNVVATTSPPSDIVLMETTSVTVQ